MAVDWEGLVYVPFVHIGASRRLFTLRLNRAPLVKFIIKKWSDGCEQL